MRALLLFCVFVSSARAQDPAEPTSLVISFASICCGTDHQASKRLDAVLAGTRAERSSRHWGREGERTALTEKFRAALEKAQHVSRRTGPCPAR